MTRRVVFLGNDPWSVPSLEALAGDPDVELALALTNPPRPAGRGSMLRPTAVAEVARTLGVDLREVDGVRASGALDAIGLARPDVVVVVAYGHLLPPELLAVAPDGALNLHFSLLPRWRGASPVQHTLLAGDERAGVTVMRMDEGLDTGPILAQLDDEVRADDDAGTLGERLARLGSRLLIGVVLRLGDGALPERPQDEGAATWAPRLGPDDRELSWDATALDLLRRVRALAPEPGGSARSHGQPIRVIRAVIEREATVAAPGTITASDARGVVIAVRDGGVRLLEVAPAGRRRMSAADWFRGARFAVGDVLR